MDSKINSKLLVSVGEDSGMSTSATTSVPADQVDENNISSKEENGPSVSASASASNPGSGSSLIQGEETVSKRGKLDVVNRSSREADKERKSSAHSKKPLGKRKVDWTPELHKQFVQAVEQLGVDKAVPSRILEIMGIDCLTRHNVASHLQKYRSHRKHLLAREAEALSWSRRRQIYGTASKTGKRELNSWAVPTTGFPPVTSMPHVRPLHVWGHPFTDQSMMYVWPNHLASSPSPPPSWTPAHPLPGDPSIWYCHLQNAPAPGMPCYPPHFPPTRCPTQPVPGIPPASMYRVDTSVGVPPAPSGYWLSQQPFDFHPQWEERIDEVIGDVLSRPWLPMPLGLKPPSIDSVIVELQRQGISKIPPTYA